MTDNRPLLALIDTFGLLYKLYFTMPRMTATDGTPTNVAFGIARLMTRIINDHSPDYIVAAMESKSPTFRHVEYPLYKAHRDKMPDDLRVQVPIVDEIISAAGLTPLSVEGYEADDVIGTLASMGVERGAEVRIITGDRDMFQLVGDGVFVQLTSKGVAQLETYDAARVFETIGVPPSGVIEKKALEGDKSDNIPGVPGIGEKTALALLDQFGTLEGIYDSIENIKSPSVKNKLVEGRELAFVSRRLATIIRDVPVGKTYEDFRFDGFDTAGLRRVFEKYGFRSLLKELPAQQMWQGDLFAGSTGAEVLARPAEVGPQLGSRYRAVFDMEDLSGVLARARSAGRLCIDLETTGLDPFSDSVVGISLAHEVREAVYVPVAHCGEAAEKKQTGMFDEVDEKSAASDPDIGRQLCRDEVMAMLKPLLEDPEMAILGHNLKFDMAMLRRHGITKIKPACDTFVAAYLNDPSSRHYGLKDIASRITHAEFRTFSDMAGTGKSQKTFDQITIADAVDYACSDVDAVLHIEPVLTGVIRETGQDDVFRKIEMPLVPVLAELEWNGIAIDTAALATLSLSLADREKEIQEKIIDITGSGVNLNSPKQVGTLLYDQLGLRKVSKRSTDISVLEELAGDHEVVPLIMEYRHLSKLRGTYVDALPSQISNVTGRLHTSFNQTLTATGRLSSSNPNLQNIPIRTEEGRKIRRAFVPGASSQILLSADYSQVEVRLLAHLSGDETLIDSFRRNEDIHRRTAAEVYGVAPEDVTTDMRRYAKTINFGIIYGKTEYGLAKELGISRKEAGEFIERYFGRYEKVREFIDETKESVTRDGWVTTLFGRRRRIPEAQSANRNEREGGYRMAVNTRVQGTAADVMKLAMIRIHDLIEKGGLHGAKMLLQVHDELVFEVEKSAVGEVAKVVRHEMEHCADELVEMKAPLIADVKTGPNWADMEALEVQTKNM